MSAYDLLTLFLHFAMLSMLAIGGALGASPEMHRFMVDERAWLTHTQFTDSITLAQAAPGPNILFVTLLGWQAAGPAGALATTAGILLPSSITTFWLNRWKTSRNDTRIVRAIRLGLSPLAIGLTFSAGWVVAANNEFNWRIALVTLVTIGIVLRTRLNMLWLIAAGALLGMAGVL